MAMAFLFTAGTASATNNKAFVNWTAAAFDGWVNFTTTGLINPVDGTVLLTGVESGRIAGFEVTGLGPVDIPMADNLVLTNGLPGYPNVRVDLYGIDVTTSGGDFFIYATGGTPGPQGMTIYNIWQPSTGQIAVTSDLQAGIPEPTAWAMMLVGIGGIGGALRRRRGNNYQLQH